MWPERFGGNEYSHLRSPDNGIFVELRHDRYYISLNIVHTRNVRLAEARLTTQNTIYYIVVTPEYHIL
jgi:hypothetical protein